MPPVKITLSRSPLPKLPMNKARVLAPVPLAVTLPKVNRVSLSLTLRDTVPAPMPARLSGRSVPWLIRVGPVFPVRRVLPLKRSMVAFAPTGAPNGPFTPALVRPTAPVIRRVPALMVVFPVKLFTFLICSSPVPDLVSGPVPEMMPPAGRTWLAVVALNKVLAGETVPTTVMVPPALLSKTTSLPSAKRTPAVVPSFQLGEVRSQLPDPPAPPAAIQVSVTADALLTAKAALAARVDRR